MESSGYLIASYGAVSSSVSMTMIGCPTAQIESFWKFISLTMPEVVEGILATSLSVKTSHKSSN